MKAITITPGKGQARLTETAEPRQVRAFELKVRVLQVGICGTDREEAEGGRADAPQGSQQLIIGHEMLGQVVAVGDEVTDISIGDYGLFTVRRGCGRCTACLHHRSDMCYTGDYTERGIYKQHGYQAEYVVDEARYFVKVPAEIATLGVLTEPLSVVEKAIDEANSLQLTRFPFLRTTNWYEGRTVLVAGIGAVGLLCALVLRLKGARVIGLDIVAEDSVRPSFLKQIGGTYIGSRTTNVQDLDQQCGQIDAIFEAAGVSQLQFDLLDALGVNGIYAVTGIPESRSPVTVAGGALMSQLVLKNQLVVGSVNAGYSHYTSGVQSLLAARQRWGTLVDTLITKLVPVQNFEEALEAESPDAIKTVVAWGEL